MAETTATRAREIDGTAAARELPRELPQELRWVGQQQLMDGYCGRAPEAAPALVAARPAVKPAANRPAAAAPRRAHGQMLAA